MKKQAFQLTIQLINIQSFQEESDEDDHIDIDDITPYAAPGSLLRNRPKQPTTVGQSDFGDASKSKKVNPYDNVTESTAEDQEEERRYLNVEEMREHERMSSCEQIEFQSVNKFTSVFHASVMFSIMNFVTTLSKQSMPRLVDPRLL